MPNPILRRSTPIPAELTNRYARFGWTQNPFPDRPYVIIDGEDRRSNGSIYVDTVHQSEQRRFEELLIPTRERPARNMAVLMDRGARGGRGIGKTAFLNRQRNRIHSDLGQEATGGTYTLFASHVFPQGGTNNRKFWQFARLLISTFNDQWIIAQMIWRLRAFSGKVAAEVLDQADNLASTIGNDEWVVAQGVSVDRDLGPAVKQALLQAGVSEDLAEGLARHGHAPERFRTFLNSFSDYRWRQIGGPWLTNDLVSAFRLAEFFRGLIFVDDFEKIISGQNVTERRTFADDIRYSFVDGPSLACQKGFYAILFVLHPYVQELLINHWNAAGLDRTCPLDDTRGEPYQLNFKALSDDDAKNLVAAYLAKARQTANPNDALTPFTPAAIVEALRITKHVPGQLLHWLNTVVEEAVNREWADFSPEQLAAFARHHPPTPLDDQSERTPLAAPEADLRGGT